MKHSKITSVFLLAVYVCSLGLFPESASAAVPLPITAQSAVLMEGNTQRMLYSKNINEKRAPASTTKLLTALVVLDYLGLNDVITIPRFVGGIEPSKIYLKPGEKFYVKDLIRATLVNSANDAAETLGVAVAGSTQNFADLMNKKAKALGCDQSRFVRPSGLPAAGQYSTAHDMAMIMNAAQRVPFIVQTLKIKTMNIRSLNGRNIGLRNHNKMLWKDSRQVLGKTGWTRTAKHCFVGMINVGQKQVVVAILGSKKIWKDLKKLVDYQFGMAISKVSANRKMWSAFQTKKIQSALKSSGFYKGGIDGQFGPKTVRAIERFQSANGLPPDGVVGDSTWNLLEHFA